MKYRYIKAILIVSFISCLCACTKEITVDVVSDPQTVIFGELTNQNETVTVTIQHTLDLSDSKSFQAINDAVISLYEKTPEGNTNLMTNSFSSNQGVYNSSQAISTQIGYSYWIEVILGDGTQFRSAEEIMLPVIAISSIETDETFSDVLNISFQDPQDIINFYKASVRLYNQGELVSVNSTQSNDVVFNGNENASIEIDLFRFFDNPDDDDTENMGFTFPDFDLVEIALGNINFQSYQFLLNQSTQLEANEDSGEDSGGNPSQLFSTPPVSLLGNITNSTTNRTALGNFAVVSLSVENQ